MSVTASICMSTMRSVILLNTIAVHKSHIYHYNNSLFFVAGLQHLRAVGYELTIVANVNRFLRVMNQRKST